MIVGYPIFHFLLRGDVRQYMKFQLSAFIIGIAFSNAWIFEITNVRNYTISGNDIIVGGLFTQQAARAIGAANVYFAVAITIQLYCSNRFGGLRRHDVK
jgi:hypothetical protein